MLTIQIASDLHIEHNYVDIPDPLSLITPTSDILILAGDIGSLYRFEQLSGFLEQLCVHFKMDIYVPGNHEYYMLPDSKPLSMNFLESKLHSLDSNIDNLYILTRSKIKIGNVCIAGATLWSNPDIDIPKYIVRIKDINTKLYRNLYRQDLKFLNDTIKECEDEKMKLVIVSHYAPTFKILEGIKKKKKYTTLYANNLDHLLDSSKIDTWICGHSHHNFDFIADKGTRIVSNQLGKPKDHITNYKTDFEITA